MRLCEQVLLFSDAHLLCNRKRVSRSPSLKQREHVPALSSAKRAPTRSECFRNLSAQCDRHCSYNEFELRSKCDEGVMRRTSFEERALLVKSLQHEVKHRSTRLEYIFKKSCIWGFDRQQTRCDTNRVGRAEPASSPESSTSEPARPRSIVKSPCRFGDAGAWAEEVEV